MENGANIFISYAPDTKLLAEELTKALESHGFDPWVDFNGLHPGQQWREQLDRAVGDAQWLLILVGSASRATPWQEAEWGAALSRTWEDREKRLLPIVFGDSDPPPFLRNWVPLRVAPGTQSSTWTAQVMDVLRELRNDAVHTGPKNRAELRERLDEIKKAAEALRYGQTDAPPIQVDSSR